MRAAAILARHYLERSRWATVACCLGVMAFQVLVMAGWANFQRSGAVRAAPMLRRSMPQWLQSAMGIEGAAVGQLNTFLTVALQHPILLLLLLVLPMAMATDFLAGDRERRTMALLLSRPLGRVPLVLAAFFACWWRAGLVLLASVAGLGLGQGLLPEGGTGLPWPAIWLVHGNLLLLAGAAAALCLLPSMATATRGAALGICTGAGVVMYSLQFLVQIYDPIRPLAHLSLFRYFNPGRIVLMGQPPQGDSLALFVVMVVALGAASLWFHRRDLAV